MAEAKREEKKVMPIDGNPSEQDNESQNIAEDPISVDPQAGIDSALAAEVQKLKAEKEDLMQTMMRRQADFENFRKRTERDRSEEAKRGVERLVLDLIPVIDAFDRALLAHDDPRYEEYRKGITLIRKQLWDAIAKHGVLPIEAAGKIFDPHHHQAIERVESEEYPDGTIVAVFQDGYMFNGRVLRPSIVRVAVHPDEGENSTSNEN
ncbi:MAG TPA: nucleotide exchange factor GrpE [Candidatus Acidoferrales bacterium]|nr:nucleotide exchange factor GrpE [Candidatus Acidoferrales bacterium]